MNTFSVVVPTFNRAQLLPATLDAILAQTTPFQQVIVVDDGSTDETARLMTSRYASCEYVVLHKSGVQRARNTGVAAATTDWTVFCDSDDLLAPDYLSVLADLLERHPALDVVYSNHKSFGRGSNLVEDMFATAPSGFWDDLDDVGVARLGGGPAFAANLVGSRALLWPSGLAVRRSFFDILGGFEERLAGVQHEDFEFMLRAVASGNCGFLQQTLVNIRVHTANFTGTDPLVRNRDMVTLLKIVLEKNPHAAAGPLRQAVLANLDRFRHYHLNVAFARGDWQQVCTVAADMRGRPVSSTDRLRAAIARCPRPLSGIMRWMVIGIGALRSPRNASHDGAAG